MEHTETLEQRADRLVQQEVYLCVSHVVATLANAAHQIKAPYVHDTRYRAECEADVKAVADIAEQAAELAAPVLDYEEAAREAGWTYQPVCWTRPKTEAELEGLREGAPEGERFMACADAETACEKSDIEPHEREVFEYWAVSTWLADRLAEKGEKVDRDFASWNVWARTTTGQAIAADAVILEIVADLSKAEG